MDIDSSSKKAAATVVASTTTETTTVSYWSTVARHLETQYNARFTAIKKIFSLMKIMSIIFIIIKKIIEEEYKENDRGGDDSSSSSSNGGSGSGGVIDVQSVVHTFCKMDRLLSYLSNVNNVIAIFFIKKMPPAILSWRKIGDDTKKLNLLPDGDELPVPPPSLQNKVAVCFHDEVTRLENILLRETTTKTHSNSSTAAAAAAAIRCPNCDGIGARVYHHCSNIKCAGLLCERCYGNNCFHHVGGPSSSLPRKRKREVPLPNAAAAATSNTATSSSSKNTTFKCPFCSEGEYNVIIY